MNFVQKLENIIQKNNSLLCIGLDPDMDKLPKHLHTNKNPIFEFNKRIIDATHELVCVYKPNIAFYEAYGIEGLQQLKQTIEYIQEKYSEIPTILDAKIGDIGNTADMLAKSTFEYWNADATTLHIFNGKDGVAPFLSYSKNFSFLYLRSSNPSAKDFQDIEVNGQPFFQVMAEKVATWKEENFGIIAGATYPAELKLLRNIFPQQIFLVPGVGTQGGDVRETVENGIREDKSGLIISVSRAILYASDGENFASGAQKAAEQYKNEINNYRG